MLESGIVDTEQDFIVWDAFAGSGAFGLECLSRYQNANVIFTDINPTSIKTVSDNLKILGECATIRQADAIQSVAEYGKMADLIFVDPPYADSGFGGVFVHKLTKTAKTGTVLVWEQETGHEMNPDTNKWCVLRDKYYGRARFLILQKI